MANKIIHKHSSVVTDGKVKLPTSSQLEYGELAVNYAKDNETISLKNSENEIVEFKSKDYFDEKINNINTILDSKSDKTHKHDLASITTGTITLTGDVTGTITYNGTNAISATTTVGNNSHTHTSANITDSISSNTDITSATTALVQGKAVKGYVDSAVETINSDIESLQKQVDGEVTSWFLEGAPTLTNAPAKDWTTDDEKQRHEGDTYTNINSSAIDHIGNSDIWEQGSTVEEEGLTYEQCKYSHTQRLRTKELLKNSNAKLLANSNWTIFVLYFDENKLYTGNNIGWTTEVTLDASYPYIAILLNKEYTTVTPNDIEFPIRIEGKFDYDPTAGQSWRWCNVDDEYGTGWHWHKIADSDAVKALAEAGKAQATANSAKTSADIANDKIDNLDNLYASINHTHDDYLQLSGGTMTGSIILPGDDTMGLIPAVNNYGTIGLKDKKFYTAYISNIHAITVNGANVYGTNVSGTTVKGTTISGTNVYGVTNIFEGGIALNKKYLSLSGGTMTGSIILPGDDTMGLIPAEDNYGTIGLEDKRFYTSFITEMRSELLESNEIYGNNFYKNGLEFNELYSPLEHGHSAGDITGGTLALARIPTGTSSSTVARGDHSHSNYTTNATFTGHTSALSESGATGHVKIITGDVNGKTYTKGEAAAAAHTHGNYLTSQSISHLATKDELSGYTTDAEFSTLQTTVNGKAASSHNHGKLILTGDATGNVTITSGTGDMSLTVAVKDDSHNHSASTITGGTLALARIPTGTSSSTVARGDHSHSNYSLTGHTHNNYSLTGHNHSGTYAPVNHASTATSYGSATTTNYGHVKIVTGDVSTVTSTVNGQAAASYHNHDGRYGNVVKSLYFNTTQGVNIGVSGVDDKAYKWDFSKIIGNVSLDIRFHSLSGATGLSNFIFTPNEKINNITHFLTFTTDRAISGYTRFYVKTSNYLLVRMNYYSNTTITTGTSAFTAFTASGTSYIPKGILLWAPLSNSQRLVNLPIYTPVISGDSIGAYSASLGITKYMFKYTTDFPYCHSNACYTGKGVDLLEITQIL